MLFRKRTVLYFSPHQDDELLSMGIDICTSLKKKYDVHVILCSDGSKSGVKRILNNSKTCKKHDGIHQYDLTTEEFIQARDQEFIGSCLALGIPKSNIHIPEDRAIDGSLTVSHAEKLIRRFVSQFSGNVDVCTIASNNGPSQHCDHKNLGKAANNLLSSGIIQKVRFFIEPYLYNQIKDNPRLIPIAPTKQKASPSVALKIEAAIESYSLWAPKQHRYAVGYHSVTTEFRDYLAEKTCFFFDSYHPKSISKMQQLYMQHRKWLKLKHQKQLYYSCTTLEPPKLDSLLLVSIQEKDTVGYEDFCNQYNMTLREKDIQRIRDGSSFWCLTSMENEVLSSGWLAYQQAFYIGETDFGFHMNRSNTAILYDFNTIPSQRGKGLYCLLLRGIVDNASFAKQFIIYTAPDNYASSKGILKAGFQYNGTLSASDNSLKQYLHKQNFTNIYRKHRYWGLKVDK